MIAFRVILTHNNRKILIDFTYIIHKSDKTETDSELEWLFLIYSMDPFDT